MGNLVATQAYLFYIALAGGAVTGVIFDIFRAFRKQVKGSVTFVAIQDILFWIITAAVIFGLLLKYNYGEPRVYFFMGIIIGGMIYHLTVSKFIVAVFAGLFHIIYLSITFIIKILAVPYKIMRVPVRFIVLSLTKYVKKTKIIFKSVKNNLKKTKKQLKMY